MPNQTLQRTRRKRRVAELGRSAAEGSPMDERRELVEIDLSAVTASGELHTELARALGFPDFYGRNWAAFWDAITGLVEMPRRLRLVGWARFAARLPDEARHLRGCLADALAQYPEWSLAVEDAEPGAASRPC